MKNTARQKQPFLPSGVLLFCFVVCLHRIKQKQEGR